MLQDSTHFLQGMYFFIPDLLKKSWCSPNITSPWLGTSQVLIGKHEGFLSHLHWQSGIQQPDLLGLLQSLACAFPGKATFSLAANRIKGRERNGTKSIPKQVPVFDAVGALHCIEQLQSSLGPSRQYVSPSSATGWVMLPSGGWQIVSDGLQAA